MHIFDLRRIVTVGLLRTEVRAVARWRALLDLWLEDMPADRPAVDDPHDEERRMAMAVLLARKAAT